MLKLFKNRRSSILGMDISSTTVKALEISYNGERYTVEGYGSLSLPERAMEGTVIKDIEAVATCIKKLLLTSRLTCKKVAIAVPDSAAISKVIQINEGLRDEEIEELIVMEADKYIPYPIDEINIDFDILGPSSKNSAMLDVMIVASRSENVNNRIDAINRAGLEATIVDVESYALERAAQLLAIDLPNSVANKIVAIIDIGAVYTRFFVLHGMKIIFSREEEFGGKQLIDAIMQRYKMQEEDVLVAIDQGKLPDDYANEILRPFNESILLQVKRALQFFFSTSHHTFVDYILLGGGVAKQAGIAQLFQEHINIPTAVANPFNNMDLSKKVNRQKITKDSPGLLVACGLALRSS